MKKLIIILLIVAAGIPVYFWLSRNVNSDTQLSPELLGLVTEPGVDTSS